MHLDRNQLARAAANGQPMLSHSMMEQQMDMAKRQADRADTIANINIALALVTNPTFAEDKEDDAVALRTTSKGLLSEYFESLKRVDAESPGG